MPGPPGGDAFRRFRDESRLPAAKDGEELQPGVTLGKDLVFENICALSGAGDYRAFAQAMTQAMHQWGVLPEGTGFVDGKLISQTGELVFDPDHAQFAIQSEKCAYFSGQPSGDISLGQGITAQAENQRLSLSACPWTASPSEAKEVLLTAVGETGMDETAQSPVEFFPGVPFTACAFQGKLYADTWRAPSPLRETPPLSLWTCMATSLGRSPGRQQLTGRGSTSLRTCLLAAYLLKRN